MGEKILIVYKSVTGFTREYAEMTAKRMEQGNKCTLMELEKATVENMSDFDTIIFGGRMHAGVVDGLKKAKELFGKSRASRFIVFATGAVPNTEERTISEMWSNNLTPEELSGIPHFYMQSGLRYGRMPLSDKMMMKVFCSMMKIKMRRKKNKDESDMQFEQMIAGSYDISDEKYIEPLVEFLK